MKWESVILCLIVVIDLRKPTSLEGRMICDCDRGQDVLVGLERSNPPQYSTIFTVRLSEEFHYTIFVRCVTLPGISNESNSIVVRHP